MIPSSDPLKQPETRPAGQKGAGPRLGGSLQLRLTLLALAVSIPLIAGITIFLTTQAQKGLSDSASKNLRTANSTIAETMKLWLDYNSRALKTLVSNPDTVTMNSLWQKPLVKEMAANYPYMYLVSTTDVNGVNKARSDDQPVASYKERYWFQNALGGASITYETLIGKTSNRPALVVSMPILDEDGQVVGVGMFAAQLDQIFDLVKGIQLGEGGSAFIVDQRNILVAHSDPRSPILANMSGHPAVEALREGKSGVVAFVDAQGVRNQAYITQLPNGWGVVAQQTEAGLFEPIRRFQQVAFTALVIGAALLSLLIWSSIRQALRPVRELTETALAIGQGNLDRQASLSSQDELGLLAQTFNRMTAQLRDLITALESRVAERTKALERRALQLQVTSEVAREAAAIRDPEALLASVASLIPERFGYDHAGVFLIEQSEAGGPSSPAEDQPGGYAVLRAASSEGGQRMLQRGHRLRIGREGIVGYAASTGQPRIALDVGKDAVFFNNPDLPLTRSEIALPLKVQERVIGVLDVQSNQEAAFQEEDISILQILADQLALAIENTHLLAESRQAVQELESLYGVQVRQGWNKRLAGQSLRFQFDRLGVSKAPLEPSTAASREETGGGETEVFAPIELRGQRIGALRLRRRERGAGWTEPEKDLIRETMAQLALSLENARLLEEIRGHASQEELINQVVARSQSSASHAGGALNLETVMKTAVTEIGRIMRLSRLQIRLETEPAGTQGNGHPEAGKPAPNGHHPETGDPLGLGPAQEMDE